MRLASALRCVGCATRHDGFDERLGTVQQYADGLSRGTPSLTIDRRIDKAGDVRARPETVATSVVRLAVSSL